MVPRTGRSSLQARGVALAGAVALVWLIQLVAGGVFRVPERALGDLAWRAIAAGSDPERRVVVVDIDESSLAKLGPWPWPRATIEQLARRLGEAGVAAQVYDIVFAEARDDDALLARTWSGLPVTAGQIFSLDPVVTPTQGEVRGALADPSCPVFAPVSRGFIANAPQLSAAAATVGHMTPRFEDDGVIRSLPAIVCHKGRAYPALALAALAQMAQSGRAGGADAAPKWRAASPADAGFAGGPLAPAFALTHEQLPGLTVPLDATGNLRVPYRVARASLASVSAADVIAGNGDPKLLQGAVALVGATAFGLSDAVSTPLSSVASGLEVHAQTLVGLLENRVPYTPQAAGALQWLVGLASLGVLLLISHRTRGAAVKSLPAAGLALGALILGGTVAALAAADLWLPWFLPALLTLVGAAFLATTEHGLAHKLGERLSAHLGAYLPAPVARRLAATDPSGAVQAERREVTVLVADIRNFSSVVAHRSPEEATALLHAFCCIAVDVVEQHGGVVENVVGDSVLAVWNAYSDRNDHPERALEAAQALVRATKTLLEPKRPVHDSDAVQPLALGIGLETGGALVGSFGPLRRRAHAALGEPVSVAIRLQRMTQELSYPILLGPQLAGALGADRTEFVGEYLLEGLTRHYAVHAPVGWARLLAGEMAWRSADPSQSEADTWPARPLGPLSPLRPNNDRAASAP